MAEGTRISTGDLAAAGFPEEVIEALELLIRDSSAPYTEYIRRIRENPIARRVKLADLAHNSERGRLEVFDKEAEKRLEKYRRARKFLLEYGKDGTE